MTYEEHESFRSKSILWKWKPVFNGHYFVPETGLADQKLLSGKMQKITSGLSFTSQTVHVGLMKDFGEI